MGEVPLWKKLIRHKTGLIGLVIVCFVLIAGIGAPILAPFSPFAINMDKSLLAPSLSHPMGTDFFGRDVMSRIIFGARISLIVGVLSRLIAVSLGAILGLVAGYFGGKVDNLIMRLADVTLAYPGLLLLIAVMAVVGPSMVSLFIALGVVGWAGVARIIRAQVLSLREREYVLAVKSLGQSAPRIIFKHLLPNCIPQLLVLFSMGLGLAIMAEASLSFLGLGAQPPAPSWGSMISSGLSYLRVKPWLSLAPGIVITITVLGFNLLGDALRDIMDPNLQF